MSAAEGERDLGDLFGGDSSGSESSEGSVASLGTDENTAGDPLANAAVNDDDGTDPGSAAAVSGAASEAGDGADPCAGESGAGGGTGGGSGGGGGVLDQVAGAEETEAAAGAAGSGGGSRPRKTLPRMDPEEALRAFAESVGMSVDAMWDGVTRGDGGEIVEFNWSYKNLKGTLPVGDMHMPYLRKQGGVTPHSRCRHARGCHFPYNDFPHRNPMGAPRKVDSHPVNICKS